jgi:hypothetical protein
VLISSSHPKILVTKKLGYGVDIGSPSPQLELSARALPPSPGL